MYLFGMKNLGHGAWAAFGSRRLRYYLRRYHEFIRSSRFKEEQTRQCELILAINHYVVALVHDL